MSNLQKLLKTLAEFYIIRSIIESILGVIVLLPIITTFRPLPTFMLAALLFLVAAIAMIFITTHTLKNIREEI